MANDDMVHQGECWIDEYLVSKLRECGVDEARALAQAKEMRLHILHTQQIVEQLDQNDFLYGRPQIASKEWPF